MTQPTRLTVLSILAAVALGGCKGEDTTATQTPSTNPPVTTPTMPSADLLAGLDFSSPDAINNTVIPAVKKLLASEPSLAGLNLDAHLMGKVVHITGNVKNNDQKRKIDELVKPMMEKAKAAGINFLNGAIVNG